jgi:hypothetical protein
MKQMRWMLWLVLPTMLVVAGCGGTTVTVGNVATATVAPTSTATTPPAPTVDPGLIATCFGPGVDPTTVRQIDSVIFTANIGPLAYPLVQLPSGTPAKPYKLTGAADTFAGSFLPVRVDPFGKDTPYHASLFVQICNTASAATHTVQAISAKLVSFTPLAGTVDAWTPTPCDTTYYHNSPAKVVETGGCGGSYVDDLNLTGTLSVTAPGTIITTVVGSHGSLPNSLVGQESADVALTLPATPGTYSFAVGLQIDGMPMAFTGPGTAFVYAPVAHLWSGKACTTSGNLALIPASPAADYICP